MIRGGDKINGSGSGELVTGALVAASKTCIALFARACE